MSPVNNIQQIVAAIRLTMTMRMGGSGRPASLLPKERARQSPPSAARSGENALSELIARRVQEVDPGDPQRGRRTFRIFLESILLNELGESLINDPSFYIMIDEIQRCMEAEPRASSSIDAAVALLLSEARAQVSST
ncbi:MAG TPA: hypothetical protein VEC06_08625 [Paucimonas sp.]|nr:hypothetical protein [Paucimonas sp.]